MTKNETMCVSSSHSFPEKDDATWRIIPISKWLTTMVIPVLP